MRKTKNEEIIAGYVYQHDLTIKEVKNEKSANFGKPFISGTLDVAVNEDGTNVIKTHYTYVAPTTKNGSENRTYKALEKIINTNQTWVSVGKDEALKIKLNPYLDVNDFYTSNGNGEDELISVKRNEGRFAEIITEIPKDTNSFKFDMLITGMKDVEANEERHIEEHSILHGAIFNYRGEILPVELAIYTEAGRDYFASQDISSKNPCFTQVWGKIDWTTHMEQIETESAFGEALVREVPRGHKQWIVTGALAVPYDFGDEAAITEDEVVEKMQQRNVKLAEAKAQREEYLKNRNSHAAPAATPIQNTGFNF